MIISNQVRNGSLKVLNEKDLAEPKADAFSVVCYDMCAMDRLAGLCCGN